MKKLIVLLIVCLLFVGMTGVAYADDDELEVENETDDDADETETDDDDDESGENNRKQIRERVLELVDENQNRYEVTVRTETKANKNETKIKVRNVEVLTNLAVENITENATMLKLKLSNGNHAEVKIMPDRASEVALEKLRSKNVTLELKEVGTGNQSRVQYYAEGDREVKLLGLFKVKARITARINAETGEVEQLNEPWWLALATEE